MGGEQQGAGGDAGAAGRDQRTGEIDPGAGERFRQFGVAAIGAVVVEQRGVGEVGGAGNVSAGDAVRIRRAAGETLGRPGVEHLLVAAVEIGAHERLVDDEVRGQGGGELRLAGLLGAGGERPPLGAPFSEAAVEDRDLRGAEMPHHPPRPRGGPQRRIVIKDDAAVVADAERLHPHRERARARHHVWARIVVVLQRRQIEEHRAGNVSVEIFGARIPAAAAEEVAGVDDDEVVRAEFGGQPFGRDQAIHERLPLHRARMKSRMSRLKAARS